MAVLSFCGLCLLLLVGKTLRVWIPLFQRLYLPASVLGGIAGLAVLQLCGNFISPNWTAGWEKLPGFLINIVFAGLFFGIQIPNWKKIWNQAGPQVCYGQIVAWGQYVVGLGLVGLLLMPLFGVPALFGNLLEIGFEGGHGTVGGLAEMFEQVGWKEGKDLGLATATSGMICGIVIGMALINWAVRRGFVTNIRSFGQLEDSEKRGIYPPESQPSAGRQTVSCDSIDSLAWHIALIGLAVFCGFELKQGVLLLHSAAPSVVQNTHVLESFPLFPLCMIGGLFVQMMLHVLKLGTLVDREQILRITGAALDFLVVSAIASMSLSFVAQHWLPLLILITAGVLWNVFCLMILAPRMLQDAWFERAIAEFGQSMGVTATGLLLLRTVDPDSKTCAASIFGYKQLFHEPIMGGGIWTSLAIPLVLTLGVWPVWWISLAALVLWFIFWKFVFCIK